MPGHADGRLTGLARRNVKTATAVAGAAAVLAGTGFVAGRGSVPRGADAERPGAEATTATVARPAPVRTGGPVTGSAVELRRVNGVPVGYPHTRSGALSAAANYTAAFGSPAVLTAAGREGLAEAVEPAGAAGGAGDEVRAQLAEAPKSSLLAGLARDRAAGRPMVLQALPITVKLLGTYGPSTTKVAVYTATYVAGSENTATVGHGTAYLTLIWWRGDWKLKSITNRPETGPVPAGYDAPPDGWQPGPGGNLVDASEQVRDAMSGGTVPTYVVP